MTDLHALLAVPPFLSGEHQLANQRPAVSRGPTKTAVTAHRYLSIHQPIKTYSIQYKPQRGINHITFSSVQFSEMDNHLQVKITDITAVECDKKTGRQIGSHRDSNPWIMICLWAHSICRDHRGSVSWRPTTTGGVHPVEKTELN